MKGVVLTGCTVRLLNESQWAETSCKSYLMWLICKFSFLSKAQLAETLINTGFLMKWDRKPSGLKNLGQRKKKRKSQRQHFMICSWGFISSEVGLICLSFSHVSKYPEHQHTGMIHVSCRMMHDSFSSIFFKEGNKSHTNSGISSSHCCMSNHFLCTSRCNGPFGVRPLDPNFCTQWLCQ